MPSEIKVLRGHPASRVGLRRERDFVVDRNIRVMVRILRQFSHLIHKGN